MWDFVGRKIGRKVALSAGAAAAFAAVVGVWLAGEPVASRDTVIFASAILVGVLATTLAVQQMVIKPLDRLARVMGRAESGDFLIRARVDTRDELGQLARQFNVMLARITDLSATQIDTEREKELMQRELDLKAELAAQGEQLAARVKELQLLIDITRAIGSTLEVHEVLSKITDMVGVTLGFREFALLLYEEDKGEYVITETYGLDQVDGEVEGLRFKETEGIVSLAHEARRTVLVEDTSKEPRYLHFKGRRKVDGSLLVIPMIYRDRIVGALSFPRPEVAAFNDEEVGLLEAVAAQAALAITNARLYQKTVELSLTDPLTGVFNRRHLEQRLEMELNRARRFGDPLSVIMIDIDHFKKYNDAHGHPMGDRVLKDVASTLRASVRRVDTVARYGGEEFTILLPRIGGEQAAEVAEKVRAAVFTRTFPGGETQPLGRVSLSLGVGTFPHDAGDAHTLLDRADAALYCAKSGGRNQVVSYRPGMEDTSQDVPAPLPTDVPPKAVG